VWLEPAGQGETRGRTELEEWFRAEGLTPQPWETGPGDRYGWHRHDYHKVLFCLSGSIVFHTGEGDV
jgi:quercetin dioxygenase-like cupin family protein